MQKFYDSDSDQNSVVNFKNMNDEELNYKKTESDAYTCKICSNNTNTPGKMILSCNHIFHIQCLAESHFKDIYLYPVIDVEYFASRQCPCCSEKIQTEELMYIHSKFLLSTKTLISNHENSIAHLESQLKQIREDLRTCYDYKHKIEQEREKAKQIVSILTTMV
jgi:uncharacterized protein (UPF0212 family)